MGSSKSSGTFCATPLRRSRVKVRSRSRAGLKAADVIRIEVSDTGSGIPDEAKEHLFEPFFTTKRGGTGLGLATIYRIVEDHDGVIGVETSSKGTTFTIDLPVRTHFEGTTDPTESALIALSRSSRESSTQVSSKPISARIAAK
jgi:nitrogen-specific signal transduction histidine kinase